MIVISIWIHTDHIGAEQQNEGTIHNLKADRFEMGIVRPADRVHVTAFFQAVTKAYFPAKEEAR